MTPERGNKKRKITTKCDNNILEAPTIWEVLCDLKRFGINPNRFDKLYRKHRHHLAQRVLSLDGTRVVRDPKSVILDPQSGVDYSVGLGSSQPTAANVQFVDENAPNSYDLDSTMDKTRTAEDTSDVDLAKFFARPVKIKEYEWQTNLALADTFDPWSLFFENKRVMNRISNFNLLRANLKLKVILNGNGFQYGRAILAYNPLDYFDDFRPSAIVQQDVVQLSQMPHIYLNPTTSQGGDLELPFFYHYNNVHQPSNAYSELGKCYIESMNILKHANGASDRVTISIFAWATDIVVSVPTSLDSSTLIPQSGEVDEANEKGVISHTATALANAAAAVARVPGIGSYAKATEMPLRTIAAVAKALGFCRPTVTKNPEPFRPFAISSLALTNVPDNAQKLTLDDKQELTIDPSISGVGSGDSLVIKDIACRESYLTTFDWNVGTAPDTLLWNARVDPVIWNELGGGTTSYHFPACAFTALPFRYWSGTMKFRFQVVCSNYHKGRLRIAFDPNFFDASPEYNVNYMQIVDIAERPDFTVAVTNGQPYSLIDHHHPGQDSVTQLFSTTRYSSKEEGNGVIQVSVLNELTIPNSIVDNDIQVNVFVSMGDDFEVYVPDDHFQHFVLRPQSGEMAVDKTQLDSEPMQDEEIALNGQVAPDDKLNLVYTGESVKSFRALLKRYYLHSSIGPDSTFHSLGSLTMNAFPFLRGNVDGAINITSTIAPYSYCNTVLLHWITYAFSGWRGSTRWKMLPKAGYSHFTSYVERSHHVVGAAQYGLNWQAALASSTPSETGSQVVIADTSRLGDSKTPSGAKGSAFCQSDVNPMMEVEFPFYSNARFQPGRVEDLTGFSSSLKPLFNEEMEYRVWCNAAEGDESRIDFHCAAGEDFTTYLYKGLPRMYYENVAPDPAV